MFRIRNWIWFAAIACMLAALARPRWGEEWEEVRRRGLDVMVLLDTSKSMLAEDLKPNRLENAKFAVRDLIGQLKGDRMGLVTFAGASFTDCPLTIDYAACRMMLDEVRIGSIPRGGTAIAQALRTAMKGFEKQTGADRVILLITDGEDHEEDPLQLVPELTNMNIRVFAIGVGSQEGELIPMRTEDGQSGYLKDSEGNTVKTRLNDTLLRQLATSTGGTFYRATAGNLGIDQLLQEQFASLKRAEAESRMTKTAPDRFVWFLGLAAMLLAVEAVLAEYRRGRRVSP